MGWFRRKRRDKRHHPTVVLAEDVRIAYPERLVLGNNISIGRECYLQARGGITIGDHTILGSRVVVLSHNHNYLTPTSLPYDEEEIVRPVVVGRYVWVGMGSMISPGTNGAVTAASAVVSTTPAAHGSSPCRQRGEEPTLPWNRLWWALIRPQP